MAEMPYGKKPSLDVTKRHKHMLVCYTADIKPLVVATPAEKWGYLNWGGQLEWNVFFQAKISLNLP